MSLLVWDFKKAFKRGQDMGLNHLRNVHWKRRMNKMTRPLGTTSVKIESKELKELIRRMNKRQGF